MVASPFKWVGGKSHIRKRIISLLPPHDCYVEVFGGAAWVILAKPPSKVEVLNDIDGDVINFFRVIKEQPDAFLASFKWELVSRQEFERLYKLSPASLDPLARAHRFYYLIMACWGGELHNPRFQTSITDSGHGNRLIGAIKHLEERIMPVYLRLQTVILEQLNWRECVERYDREQTVMYLDPPYPGNNCNYQFNMRDTKSHQELASRLRNMKARFVLTTYNLPESWKLYEGFYITPVQFPSGMPGHKGRQNRELIISNFNHFPNKLA